MGAQPSAWPTLYDVVHRMDPKGNIDTVVELLSNYNPILDDIPWIQGNLPTGHQTTVRTSKPTMQFRLLNKGVVPVKSTSGQIVDTCAMIETLNHIDRDLAALNGNTASFRMSEDKAIIESMSDTLATALIYGDVESDPEQFNGLASRYFSRNSEYTTYENVIDGGGTGSDNTSIWLVCWSPDKVFGIYPNGSQAGLKQEDHGEITIADPNTSGAYLRVLESWYQWKCGLCIRDWRYVVRIANIDISNLITAGDSSDTSANLFKLMIQAIAQLPPVGENYRPVFYMNKTVETMLRVKMQDKSNVHLQLVDIMGPTGVGRKVLTYQGIPCRRIDAILNNEDDITAS
jgi:hypothetical protein